MRSKFISSTIFFILIPFLLILIKCDDNSDYCPEETNWVIIYNLHNDPYRLLIDDEFIMVIQSQDTIKHYIDYGSYNFKLIQENGFDSIPKTYEDFLSIDYCAINTWEP